MTKFFVDNLGNYIGAFDGAEPPDGSVEVPSPPSDARLVWNGSAWTVPQDMKLPFAEEARKAAYNDSGATIEDLVLALWKAVVEKNPADADAIQVIRLKIKKDIPNPP